MKKAFIDPVTQVLTCHGAVESNNDDIPVEVPDDFDLTPGQFKKEGSTWVPIPPVKPVARPSISRPAAVTNVAQLRKTVSDLLDVLANKGVVDVVEPT